MISNGSVAKSHIAMYFIVFMAKKIDNNKLTVEP